MTPPDGNACVCLLLQVIGVQPAASDVMRQSVAAGHIVDAPSSETLSDATAGAATL
jgi:threonine dehydratase